MTINDFRKKGVAFETGNQLDTIAKAAAEEYGDKVIRILLPNGFNCYGKATDIYREVYGLMPYTYLYGDRSKCINQKDATTLFWGDILISEHCYLPFQADVDCFYVDDVVDGEVPTIKLVNGPSWRTFI